MPMSWTDRVWRELGALRKARRSRTWVLPTGLDRVRRKLAGSDDGLTIFERSQPGRRAFTPPPLDVPQRALDELIPAELRRQEPARLPEVSFQIRARAEV